MIKIDFDYRQILLRQDHGTGPKQS